MNPRRSVVLLVAAITSGALMMAGCGSADDPAAASPDPSASAPSPSTVSADCLPPDGGSNHTPPNSGPDTDAYLGLSEQQAKQYATDHGQMTRVAGRDGKCFALTMDYRTDRVNLYIESDEVVVATIG